MAASWPSPGGVLRQQSRLHYLASQDEKIEAGLQGTEARATRAMGAAEALQRKWRVPLSSWGSRWGR